MTPTDARRIVRVGPSHPDYREAMVYARAHLAGLLAASRGES